jgi:hypothetical protein
VRPHGDLHPPNTLTPGNRVRRLVGLARGR